MHAFCQRVLNSRRLPTCATGWAKGGGLWEKWGCNYMGCASYMGCHASYTGCVGSAFRMWLAPGVFIKEPGSHPLPLCAPSLSRLHPAQPSEVSLSSTVSLGRTGKHWALEPRILWVSGAQSHPGGAHHREVGCGAMVQGMILQCRGARLEWSL